MSGLQEENTAMHLAAKCGHTDVLQKILETGVDINERNIVSGLDLAAYLLNCTSLYYTYYINVFNYQNEIKINNW